MSFAKRGDAPLMERTILSVQLIPPSLSWGRIMEIYHHERMRDDGSSNFFLSIKLTVSSSKRNIFGQPLNLHRNSWSPTITNFLIPITLSWVTISSSITTAFEVMLESISDRAVHLICRVEWEVACSICLSSRVLCWVCNKKSVEGVRSKSTRSPLATKMQNPVFFLAWISLKVAYWTSQFDLGFGVWWTVLVHQVQPKDTWPEYGGKHIRVLYVYVGLRAAVWPPK